MKLRMRLALMTVAVAVPVALCMGWLHVASQVRALESALSEYALAHMLSGGRERCEASPTDWSIVPPPSRPGGGGDRGPPPKPRGRPHGPRPPPGSRLYAYDAQLSAHNPAAPALDASLVESMREGRALASRASAFGVDEPREVLVRMPWGTGPCAFALVQWPGRFNTEERPTVPFPHEYWLIPTGIALAGVLFALGPVVRRLRQLTGEVRTFVRSAYQGSITQQGNDEISELARAFDDAGREVRAQMDLKEKREQTLRSFLENTTHDVMIPLTVLQGHLAELQQHAAKGTPVEASVVAAASQEAHYMAALIHNLGAAARLEAGEPSVQRVPVNLNALVERCVGRHRPIARQQGVQLDYAIPDPPVSLTGDDTLIEQAVSNVIYNAVRYNARGGHVAVVLEREPGPAFRLRVLDDGPGIPEGELSRLVERRVRGDAARTRGPGGHGLGLNIAWKVAVLHGWSLQLGRSEYGGLQVDFLGELSSEPAPGAERAEAPTPHPPPA
ncbi:HAMP domain-containing sensor histidine kinase [Stigmatella sp. ncwal1]|uniref:histidine kinase n=1 Tax=Stigmatella ashevillensis TaxID=2995309 RepID=A0ABT5DE12_9BACT|nr:HAMP domain-containing sensor histidine kinase [Stigmatella ashevillena]MDC0711829.1 HAMP domain-containing sensor histidine kinase [Stigmatella ashevillena]